MRVPRRSTIALATAGALASTGTAYLGARNLLVGQATHARTVIPKSFDAPPRADGVYTRGGGPVQRWRREVPFDVHLMIFGDSTATGYGCASAEEVPGVLIARGLAPIEASKKALERAGMAITDIDLVEINEAFAVQVLGSARELGIDEDKLNISGGAIALGHPFGMTGARITTTLLNNLQTYDKTFGLETMCVGGGQGMAMVIERLA